jgi:pimeloyl-ACP methyl ester carboxylesterase
MTPTLRHETAVARGESVPVTIVEPDGGSAPCGDLLFLHGYARHPEDYRELLEEIAGRGYRIVAPFLFANNGLRHPSRHFWSCAALARRTIEALHAGGTLAPGAPVFGHSTGGAVVMTLGSLDPPPRALLAMNPVQPSARRPLAFMLSSAWMNAKMWIGLAGEGRRARRVLSSSSPRFYANWFRNPCAAFELIGGLRAFGYDRLVRWYGPNLPSSVPARVIYGDGDEFYPSADGLEAGLRRVFLHFDLIHLESENSHEWLMIRTERAADELERFLADVDSGSRS